MENSYSKNVFNTRPSIIKKCKDIRVSYSRLIFSLLLFANSLSAFADGSKDLYPSTTTGKRAYLQSRDITNPAVYDLFPSYGTMKVYVNVNEKLYIGSSALGLGSGAINIRKPNGTSISVTNTTSGGAITTRAQELAGPYYSSSVRSAGYTPYTLTVDVAGVWEVDFVPTSGSSSQTSQTAATQIDANYAWTQAANQPSNVSFIAAFDISVGSASDASVLIPGRVYCNNLNMNMVQGTTSAFSFYATLYVLTDVGYVYKIQTNGQNGASFEIYSNNKGVQLTTSGNQNPNIATPLSWMNGDPSYKSITTGSTYNSSNQYYIYDPRQPDNGTADVTHKIFFNIPASDLPASADIRYNGGAQTTTWLRKTGLTLPTISSLTIIGAEGGAAGLIGPDGAKISFISNVAGKYSVVLSATGYTSRTLTGDCVEGSNLVSWDGKDGVGTSITTGTSITVQGGLTAGEVHFPLADVEINPNGIIIELLQPNNTLYGPTKDLVYWDDTGISASNIHATYPSPVQNLTGLHSNSGTLNGHKWGNYSYSGDSNIPKNDFGDNTIIDTWSYVSSESTSAMLTAEVKKIDLGINSITPSVTTACVGNSVTYTIVVANITNAGAGATENAVGARFGFEAPAGFTITGHTFTQTSGTGSESNISATGSNTLTSDINLTNGGVITYTITGTVGTALAHGSMTPRAYIIRPADIIDIDATSGVTGTPTDPDVECDGGTSGVGCNNIRTAASVVTILNTAPIANDDTKTEIEDINATGNVLTNDTDVDLDVLSVTGFTVDTDSNSSQESFSAGATATITGVGSIVILGTGAFTFTPLANYNGTVPTVTYTISDGHSGTDTGVLDITITPVNDAPSFTKGSNQTVCANGGPQTISGWATALSKGPINEASQTLSFVITNNTNTGLFSSGPAVDSSGNLTYTTALNQSGSATVSLKITDNGGISNGGVNESAVQTFTITVNPSPTITLSSTSVSVYYNESSQTVNLAYSATTQSPTTYNITWNGLPVNSFAAVTDAALPSSPIVITVPAATAENTYTGYLTVKNGNSCSSSSCTFTVTVIPATDLSVTKTVDNPTPTVGSNVTFTITAKNNGFSAATGVKVTEVLPAGYSYVSDNSGSTGTTYNSGTGVWTIGSMANGATRELKIVAKTF
jgi:uncharacterized repeat protein (TIGR01451 family)